jgi:cell division protein FtsL
MAFALVTTAIVAAMVLGLVLLNVMVSENSFQLEELSDRVAGLERRVEIRRLEAARLSSPDRIARQARRLGLVVPDPLSVVHLPGPVRPEGG